MKRVEEILRHPVFRTVMEEIDRAETDRRFCRHGLEHSLAVARMCTVIQYREGTDIPEEEIYAAALLHDLGRAEEYRTGTPHHLAGITLAEEILRDAGFEEEERQRIAEAIAWHRDGEERTLLVSLLRRGDRESRPCFACRARNECYWTESEKNRPFCG